MLNLFLALLLSSFGIDKLKSEDKDDEINKIQEAIDRIKRLMRSISSGLVSLFRSTMRRGAEPPYECGQHTSSSNRKSSTSQHMTSDDFPNENEADSPPRVSTWNQIRDKAYDCVEHKYFEFFIILMIVLSSISLVRVVHLMLSLFCLVSFVIGHLKAIEDKNINSRPRLKHVLEISDKFFTVIFAIELVLKWLSYGFRKYFTDGWSWLDFIIVVVRSRISLHFILFIPI